MGFFVVASLRVYVDFYFKTVPSQLEFHPRQIAATRPSKSIFNRPTETSTIT
jgi:hypothetical protein